MDWAGWALFGLVATAALTAVMIMAQLAGLTRLDLPLLLGTIVTEDPDRARVAGFFLHLVIGQGFALGYAACFSLLDRASWWLGGLFGLLHVAVSLTVFVPLLEGVHPRMASHRAGRSSTAVLEPPGLGGLNYGGQTPLVTIAAHLTYGVALGMLLGPADMRQRFPSAGEAARPIEDYGLLGDTRTAALVGSDGAIDWLCVPRFDGQPVFGRLVGGPAAGTFRMGPAGAATVTVRRYRPHTATLETSWDTSGGRLTLTEGMIADVTGRLLPSSLLVRRLTATGSPVDAVIEFDPRLGEHHRPPRIEYRGGVVVCSWSTTALALRASPPLRLDARGPVRLRVAPGRPVTLALSVADREPLIYVDPDAAWAALAADEHGWRTWCADIDGDLPHRDAVARSLLTLRLLTYSPSGAPVAAPTASLPEDPGGIRNWDYRFAWPRDASIGIGAFLGVGKHDEARHFLAWLLHASRLDRPRLPVLLTLHGRRPTAERELDGWPGYAHSRPVRVGNGAANQHQLDGYGWVLDAAWLLTRAGQRLDAETWRAMRGFADQVAKRWREPDAGIWEIRGDGAHHVHSKLMAWLALDRAVRIACTRRTPGSQVARWHTERDAMAADIIAAGFNPELGSYTRSYGSNDLDAAVLVLPLLDLEPRDSPRVRATIEAVRRELSAGGPLLYRYPPGQDGLPGTEGAFLPCSFWLVQALASTGRVDEATQLFADLLELVNPLGLLPEEINPKNHGYLGNYPQALTHAALIQAALAIRDAHPRLTT